MFQMYPSNFNFLLKNSVANHQNFKLHPFFQLPTIKISKQPKNFYYSILATSPQINSYSQSHLYYSKTTQCSRHSLLLNPQLVIRIHVHNYPVRQPRLPGTANTIIRYGKHDYPVRQPRLPGTTTKITRYDNHDYTRERTSNMLVTTLFPHTTYTGE